MTIQKLNDAFRTSLSTDLGRVVMTGGVACSDAETIALILAAVRTYDQFDEGIDPYGEHDMERFTVGGEDDYWKIDYYERNLEGTTANNSRSAILAPKKLGSALRIFAVASYFVRFAP